MFTVTIFKKDARCKSGQKLVARKEVEEFNMDDYSAYDSKYFIDVQPFKKVRNLMTGEEITIPADTPHSCDPSTELYWTM